MSEYIISPSLTVNSVAYDIVDGSYNFDPELHEIITNGSFFSDFTLGNCNATITVVTKDYALAKLYSKGKEATSVVLTFKKAPLTAPTDPEDYTFVSGGYSVTFSSARSIEPVEIKGAADKAPGEYTITFKAARVSSTKADPTITIATVGS